MNEHLQEIKDTVASGDIELARSKADAFVAANPSLFFETSTKTVAELVSAIDVFRQTGMEDEQWRVEAWLLHHYEPQNIGGPADATVRVVG